MKTKVIILTFLFSLFFQFIHSQNIGIGTTTPEASAMLDITSSDKGLLIPRLDTSAISSPVVGLLIFSPTDKVFYFYTGSKWTEINQNILALNDLSDSKTNYTTGYNIFIGQGAGDSILAGGLYNTSLGIDALKKNTDGDKNSAIGNLALYGALGNNNIALGYRTGFYQSTGNNNTIIGVGAGEGTVSYSRSGAVYLGFEAGKSDTTDDKLYIENSASPTPLIYGDFANDSIKIYGTLGIKDVYNFPITDGANGQVLTTNGSGNVSWANNSISELNDLSDVITDYTTGFNMIAGDGGGGSMVATATHNSGWGYTALRDLTSGKRNSAFGRAALYLNTTGEENSAFGAHAMAENLDGGRNVGFGDGALFKNKSGNYNTSIGTESGKLVLGSNNVFLGYEAGAGSTDHSKSGSVFLGYRAGKYEFTDDKLYIENSASSTPLIYGDFADDTIKIYGTLGIKDMYNFPITDGANGQVLTTNGSGNVSWANNSISELDDLSDVITDYTTGFNMIAGDGGGGSMVATAKDNSGWGYTALRDLTSGKRNSAFGGAALYLNTSGEENSAFGTYALAENLDGGHNVGFGDRALFKNVSGDYNTSIGTKSGRLVLGSNNVFMGYEAGAGSADHSKSGSIFLGYQAGKNELTDNKLYIENSASSTPLIYGDFALDSIQINGKMRINCTSTSYDFVTSEYSNEPVLRSTTTNYGYLGTPDHVLYKTYSNFFYAGDPGNYLSYSDRNIKENINPLHGELEKLISLRPVSYDLKSAFYLQGRELSSKEQNSRFGRRGFIAQEMEEIFPEIVHTDKKSGLKSIGYQGLIPIIVKAIQEQDEKMTNYESELSNAESKIEHLRKENEDLKLRIKNIEKLLETTGRD